MDRSHFRALSHLRNFIPCAHPARTTAEVEAQGRFLPLVAVSYTHLTLPTKRIV